MKSRKEHDRPRNSWNRSFLLVHAERGDDLSVETGGGSRLRLADFTDVESIPPLYAG